MRTHLLMLMATLVVPATVFAQGAPAAPPAGPAPRPADSPDHRIPGWRRDSRSLLAGRRTDLAGAVVAEHPGGHGQLRPAHAGSRRRPQQEHRGPGALAGVGNPGHGHWSARGHRQGTGAARRQPADQRQRSGLPRPRRARPRVPATTTRSSSSRSTRRSTSRPGPTRGKRGRPCRQRCRGTSWARPCTWAFSAGHNSPPGARRRVTCAFRGCRGNPHRYEPLDDVPPRKRTRGDVTSRR